MFDIYGEVTNRIVEELESGVIPWEKPWTGVMTGAVSHATGKPYSLINQYLLGKEGEHLTFKQALAAGGNVKKGAKGRMVVFWKMLTNVVTDDAGNPKRDADGNPITKNIPVLKYYTVFHIDDCENIEPKFKPEEMPKTAEAVERAEAAILDYTERANVKLIHEKQNRAFYSPSKHAVVLPLMEQFAKTAEYYSTAFHELTHSTGHKSLLNRFPEDAADAAFGSESYSKEELVAEIGAATTLHELGMETKSSFRNSTAYIQSWITALKNDKKLIISAAARAEKAVKLILNIEQEETA